MLRFISRSMIPLAYRLAGPLFDKVFSPLLMQGGALAKVAFGQLIGVGPGRSTGLIFILSDIMLFIVSGLALLTPRIRNMERDLSDEVDAFRQTLPQASIELEQV